MYFNFQIINLDDSEDSSVEEFEDATESFTADDDFISDMRSRRLQPLSEYQFVILRR